MWRGSRIQTTSLPYARSARILSPKTTCCVSLAFVRFRREWRACFISSVANSIHTWLLVQICSIRNALMCTARRFRPTQLKQDSLVPHAKYVLLVVSSQTRTAQLINVPMFQKSIIPPPGSSSPLAQTLLKHLEHAPWLEATKPKVRLQIYDSDLSKW